MNVQIWSGILTAIGLAGFFLAGKKIWWAWYVNIFNQVIWFFYSIVTEQWPFLVGVVAYSIIFTKNAIAWTKEHNAEVDEEPFSDYDFTNPIGTAEQKEDGSWLLVLDEDTVLDMVEPIRCPDCDGMGFHSITEKCWSCLGTGWV